MKTVITNLRTTYDTRLCNVMKSIVKNDKTFEEFISNKVIIQTLDSFPDIVQKIIDNPDEKYDIRINSLLKVYRKLEVLFCDNTPIPVPISTPTQIYAKKSIEQMFNIILSLLNKYLSNYYVDLSTTDEILIKLEELTDDEIMNLSRKNIDECIPILKEECNPKRVTIKSLRYAFQFGKILVIHNIKKEQRIRGYYRTTKNWNPRLRVLSMLGKKRASEYVKAFKIFFEKNKYPEITKFFMKKELHTIEEIQNMIEYIKNKK